MGKKEERDRVKKAMAAFVTRVDDKPRIHLHDLCCDLDRYMDSTKYLLDRFCMDTVGSDYVTYIEEKYGVRIRVTAQSVRVQ